MSAAGRRSQEFNNKIEFVIDEKKYSWIQSLDISCKNFYFKSEIEIDGEKKDIRAIKKLIEGYK